jgi:hypothetical protein
LTSIFPASFELGQPLKVQGMMICSESVTFVLIFSQNLIVLFAVAFDV